MRNQQTPAQRLGYIEGALFEVNGSNVFSDGSLVILEKDDGSNCPLFKLISGHCSYKNGDKGREGAWTELSKVKPILNHMPKGSVSFHGKLGKMRVSDVIPAPDKFDVVKKPAHYNQGDVECIDAIKAALTPAEFRGYLKGNAMKYIWRESHKGTPQIDAQKAAFYVNKLAGLDV